MRFKKIIAIALAAGMLCACGSNETGVSPVKKDTTDTSQTSDNTSTWSYDGSKTTIAKEKTESVSVSADASGSPKEITVTTKLSGITGSSVVEDKTTLTDIKNKNGDEQFEVKDGVIYWENSGSDISYTGTTTESIPISVKVTYYLDGKEVSASEIAGKSGKVKIRFDYENNEKYGEVHVPFLCMSAVILSDDSFSNVTAENAEVMDMDGSVAVIGYAMPGVKEELGLSDYESLKDVNIPDYVEISADAEEFALDFTETVVSTGLFTKIESDDIDSLNDLTEGMRDLGEGGDELTEGADSLSSGYDELSSALNSYIDGVSQLGSRISSFASGAKTLNDNSSALVTGAKALSDALSSIDLSNISTGIDTTAIQNDLTTIAAAAQSLSDAGTNLQALVTTLSGILDTTSLSDEEKQAVIAAFASSEAYTGIISALTQAQQSFTTALTDIQNQFASIDTSSMDTMKKQFEQLKSAASQLYQGAAAMQSGISSLNSGAAQLNSGASQITGNNGTVKDALSKYKSGLSGFADGLKKFNDEGLQEFSEKFGTKGQKLVDKVSALREAEESYKTFTALSDGQDGSVSFTIETEKISE